MKKEINKVRATAAVLSMLVLGSSTAGCAKNTNKEVNVGNDNVSSNSFDISVEKNYKIVLGLKELTLNNEQYTELVNAVIKNELFYNRDVKIEDEDHVKIERLYNLNVFGENITLNEKDYDSLVQQLLEYEIGNVVNTQLDETIDEVDAYEPLTTENFENLVSEYANKYSSEYDGIVETKDIIKFASIANIDLLSEENRELANELFSNQTKEEYLNDAAKLIGTTVMYNFKQWNTSLSTKDFIKVSDIIYGEQKDKMLKIEEYTDRIASAVIMNDTELVNNIVSEFLTDMNSESLSKLDDGVGFAAQVNIAVIADGIARNHLNKENFDMFQVLKTSEKYVSNIFTEYEECASVDDDVKTLTKTN